MYQGKDVLKYELPSVVRRLLINWRWRQQDTLNRR